jgi:hypothetical protein
MFASLPKKGTVDEKNAKKRPKNKLYCFALVHKRKTEKKNLKAFTMDDGRSAFVVFLFADPHLLESGQRG